MTMSLRMHHLIWMENPDDCFLDSESPMAEEYDKLIGSKLLVPRNGLMTKGIVRRRNRNYDGTLIHHWTLENTKLNLMIAKRKHIGRIQCWKIYLNVQMIQINPVHI